MKDYNGNEIIKKDVTNKSVREILHKLMANQSYLIKQQRDIKESLIQVNTDIFNALIDNKLYDCFTINYSKIRRFMEE